ncbi:hypothetical protein DFP73DRAFT_583228 [Morchella snyderi]|nr:hypothetical protein DFP73DRAFT_583228 [Morchella snyderi]
MSSVSSLSSVDSDGWNDVASLAELTHSRDETLSPVDSSDWSVTSATNPVLSRDESLTPVNSDDWSISSATECVHSHTGSVEPTEKMEHPDRSEVLDDSTDSDESKGSEDCRSAAINVDDPRCRLLAAYNAEPPQTGAYKHVAIDISMAFCKSSITPPPESNMTFSHPPPHVLFAGYHPTLYFRPKSFILPSSLDRAVEATNAVHRWAHARLHTLMVVSPPPPQPAGTPKPFTDYKGAYNDDTVRALNDAATYYREAQYGAPAVTPEEISKFIPDSVWDGSPKHWLGCGGMVGRLLHGLLWTSYEEREKLYQRYPEFWDVVRCPGCGIPREMGVWCTHAEV